MTGDSFSPVLFNIVIVKILDKVKLAERYKLGTSVCYVFDGTVLTADSEDNLQIIHLTVLTVKR